MFSQSVAAIFRKGLRLTPFTVIILCNVKDSELQGDAIELLAPILKKKRGGFSCRLPKKYLCTATGSSKQ